jgi:hypothetical protein
MHNLFFLDRLSRFFRANVNRNFTWNLGSRRDENGVLDLNYSSKENGSNT